MCCRTRSPTRATKTDEVRSLVAAFDPTLVRLACCQSGVTWAHALSTSRPGSAGRQTADSTVSFFRVRTTTAGTRQTWCRAAFADPTAVFILSRWIIKMRVYPRHNPMESNLTSQGRTPQWDEAFMRALSKVSAPVQESSGLVIGVEDDTGAVYRIVRTNGLCETVRLFESARELGFDISGGRTTGGQQAHRVLRRAPS